MTPENTACGYPKARGRFDVGAARYTEPAANEVVVIRAALSVAHDTARFTDLDREPAVASAARLFALGYWAFRRLKGAKRRRRQRNRLSPADSKAKMRGAPAAQALTAPLGSRSKGGSAWRASGLGRRCNDNAFHCAADRPLTERSPNGQISCQVNAPPPGGVSAPSIRPRSQDSMPTASHDAIVRQLQEANYKQLWTDETVVRSRVAALSKDPADPSPPANLTPDVRVERTTRRGWPCFELLPRNVVPAGQALYLHGGAYIHEIRDLHWIALADLVARSRFHLTVPIYPLAPSATADIVVPTCALLIEEMATKGQRGESITVIGDSAGGGLALAAATMLSGLALRACAQLVLISPWIDVAFSDPRAAEIDSRDPVSSIAGLRVAGDLYRGDLAREHPWVSPINADLAGLPPVMVFSGTRDVCNPAARQLCERAAAAGVDVDFQEGLDLVHVYPILPCDEGVDARQTIADALIAGSHGPLR